MIRSRRGCFPSPSVHLIKTTSRLLPAPHLRPFTPGHYKFASSACSPPALSYSLRPARRKHQSEAACSAQRRTTACCISRRPLQRACSLHIHHHTQTLPCTAASMEHDEADKLVKQLSTGFDTLQQEYQKLFGRHEALERKLATARDQVSIGIATPHTPHTPCIYLMSKISSRTAAPN